MLKAQLTALLALGCIVPLFAQEKEKQVEEVVITALGIKKEKRKTASAVQSISGKEMTEVRTVNPLDNLAGKISGVQITGGTSGVASSSRIVIRGEKSLNINNNNPLFIIDGVPVNNQIFGVGGGPTDQSDLPTDYGSGISDINPDDIESINVLKGGAAALYGSRAANGVVLITTKRGSKNKKFQISYSSSILFQKPIVPVFQDQYGEGFKGIYDVDYGANFGPKMNGQLMLQDGSPQFKQNVAIPFVKRYDLNHFFRYGSQLTNYIALQGHNDQVSYRVSYTNNLNEGIIPNTDLKKNTISTAVEYNVSPKTKINTTINFVKTKSDNVPVNGYGGQGLMYVLYWNHLNNDISWYKDYWQIPNEKQKYPLTWADNPYLITNENINNFDRNRLFGTIKVDHNFTDNLSVTLRTGIDYQNEKRLSRRPVGSIKFSNGMLRQQNLLYQEMNSDVLFSYRPKWNALDIDITAGASRMDRKYHEDLIQSNKLTVPGIYSLGNTEGTVKSYSENYLYRINSLLANVNIGYKNMLYVDISARNDWSSSLPTGNNSYFYPSTSISWLLDKTLALPKFFNMVKLRGSWAVIGKDTDPKSIHKVYKTGFLQGTLTNPSILPNQSIKNETTVAKEVGLDVIGGKNRWELSASYYHNISKDQIIKPQISQSSGYGNVTVNAGKILNQGIELYLRATPAVNKNFLWDIAFNFTKNVSKVQELYGDLKSYIIAEGPADVTIEARLGGKMGDMYGYAFQRTPSGEIIHSNNGIPLMTSQKQLIGNYNPDWMLGIKNHLTYKNFFLDFLFDIRKGGTVYSYTQAIGAETGDLPFTLYGREISAQDLAVWKAQNPNNPNVPTRGLISPGVVAVYDNNGNITGYKPNTTLVSPEDYYYSGGYYSRRNAEANSFDASFIKLREVSIGYSFPKSILERIELQELRISFIGRNLARWTKTPQFLDPETMAMTGGTLLPGMDVMQYPVTANFGMNFSIKF